MSQVPVLSEFQLMHGFRKRSECLQEEDVNCRNPDPVKRVVMQRSRHGIEKDHESDVRRQDATKAASIKSLKRLFLPAEVEQDRSDQKPGEDEEHVNSYPSELGKPPQLAREHFIVTADNEHYGDAPEPVQFRDSFRAGTIHICDSHRESKRESPFSVRTYWRGSCFQLWSRPQILHRRDDSNTAESSSRLVPRP
jgi:hypothetical protein